MLVERVSNRPLYNWRSSFQFLIPHLTHISSQWQTYFVCWYYPDYSSIGVKVELFVLCIKNTLCWLTKQKWGIRHWRSVWVYSRLWVSYFGFASNSSSYTSEWPNMLYYTCFSVWNIFQIFPVSEGPPLSAKEVRLTTVLRELPFTISFSNRVQVRINC